MVTNKMSLSSRIEYLKRIKPRYLKSDKKAKINMLNEFCKNTGYNREYAIRRLAAGNEISPPKVTNQKRGCYYTNEDICWLSKNLFNSCFFKYLIIFTKKLNYIITISSIKPSKT